MKRVVLLHLGLPGGAAGSAPRRRTWRALIEAVGAEYRETSLLGRHRAKPPRPGALLAVLRGDAVPESCAWSHASLSRELRELRPDAVICETSRTFHPSLSSQTPRLILDFVDRLSLSYADRAGIARRIDRRIFYRLLARRHRVFESNPYRPFRAVAAGRADAEALDATWLPNLAPAADSETAAADDAEKADLLFFGSLSYPPNLAACRRLARIWPALQKRRPGTTLKIAGRNPAAEVVAAARAHGWTLEEDFSDAATLCRSARLAAAPLEHAAGIQNKVLEAAAHGLAQVVTPAAAAGFGEDHPLVVAATDDELVDEIVRLLDDPRAADDLAARARTWVDSQYREETWLPVVRELLFGERSEDSHA